MGVIRFLVALFLIGVGIAHASPDRRVALVIGNSAYQHGPLANPVNDARAIAGRLRSLGFEVILRENLKVREIGGIYREFRSRIAPGGAALFFYAGHGVQFKGQNYFPAVDAEISSEDDVPLQSINLGNLLDNMEEAKAGISLVFLDACRDNPFARRFRSGSRGLAKVEAASGTLIHYATKPGSVASDGDGRNGTYTEALLAQINEPDVPIEQMLKRVTNRVVEKTAGKQEPWVEGSLRGDFFFTSRSTPVAPIAPVAPVTTAKDSGLEHLRQALTAPWVVTVEGETRQRSLRIKEVAQVSAVHFLLTASYGWLDGNMSPIHAEIFLQGDERKLNAVTAAGSTIAASLDAQGGFAGTFTPKSGAAKPVKLVRVEEAEFATLIRDARLAMESKAFADEDKDWNILPTTTPRQKQLHAATPLTLPGGQVMRTFALKRLLDEDKTVVVVDVLDSKERTTIPGARWMPGAGGGEFFGAESERFKAALEKLTGGDKARTLAFLCQSSECWLSYNSALRALEAGYKNVVWYRGGTNSWGAAGLTRKVPEKYNW